MPIANDVAASSGAEAVPAIPASVAEPRLLIVTDPRTDTQAITEAFYSNIPVNSV